jgi:hypothetical protein
MSVEVITLTLFVECAVIIVHMIITEDYPW